MATLFTAANKSAKETSLLNFASVYDGAQAELCCLDKESITCSISSIKMMSRGVA